MANDVAHGAQSRPTASPCVRNCCLNQNDICMGCFRSLNEIVEWSNADNSRREAILLTSQKRRSSHDK
jgi:predicted Fe-S protein YdhL (DUF1289 family)